VWGGKSPDNDVHGNYYFIFAFAALMRRWIDGRDGDATENAALCGKKRKPAKNTRRIMIRTIIS
jgi:hypothetical protein